MFFVFFKNPFLKIWLQIVVKAGAINFDALHQLLYLFRQKTGIQVPAVAWVGDHYGEITSGLLLVPVSNVSVDITLALVRGIYRWPVDSPHKRPVTRKMFSLSSCKTPGCVPGCVPEMFVASYSATYCIYIPGKPGFCFHYHCAVYD